MIFIKHDLHQAWSSSREIFIQQDLYQARSDQLSLFSLILCWACRVTWDHPRHSSTNLVDKYDSSLYYVTSLPCSYDLIISFGWPWNWIEHVRTWPYEDWSQDLIIWKFDHMKIWSCVDLLIWRFDHMIICSYNNLSNRFYYCLIWLFYLIASSYDPLIIDLAYGYLTRHIEVVTTLALIILILEFGLVYIVYTYMMPS